jgi:high-affinity nickel-transport protein
VNFLLFSILSNAFLLGLRHGIDWDHLAAIMDIVGASTSSGGGAGDSGGAQRGSISLSLFYAFGHALVVLMLGLAALLFAYALPRWIDPLMERAVGFTLIVLGLWVFYSLTRSLTGGGEFKPLSRWMAMFAWLTAALNWLRGGLSSDKRVKQLQITPYGPRTAFGVGMIHGIGAETGTQVLLMATVCGSSSHINGVAMLIAFIVGMILSNTLIAILGSFGLISSSKVRSAYMIVGVVVGIFSLIVGSYFLLGRAHLLPDLQRWLRS